MDVDGSAGDVTKGEKSLFTIDFSYQHHHSQTVHLQDCRCAKDALIKLASPCGTKAVANRMYFMEQLMSSEMSSDGKLKEYIEMLRHAVGKRDRDQYKIALLRSLPSSFEALVVTLGNILD